MQQQQNQNMQDERCFLTPSRQTTPPAQQVSLTSYGSLEQMFKVAEYLSRSPIVPDTFRGEPGSSLIALDLAARLKMPPLMVMQNVFIVHGRTGLSGQFIIAMLNRSPKYKRIEFVKTACGMKCVGHRVDGKKDEGTEITKQMAEAEGWTKNGKWKTMPEQMLRYRAASFFARVYCPEEIMGLHSVEELQDGGADETPAMRDVTPEPARLGGKPELFPDGDEIPGRVAQAPLGREAGI